MVRELEKIYVPMHEALVMAREADWPAVIKTVAELTGHSEEEVARAVSPLRQAGPALALPRSMPNATCESWLLGQTARRLGVGAVQWALVEDRYMDFNPEKRLMIHHTVVVDHVGVNGRKVRRQSLTTKQPKLNGLGMHQILVQGADGQFVSLVDFHRQWWQACCLGGVEINISQIAHQLLGDTVVKDQWYPVYFTLMSASLIFLENYTPRFCKDLWPVVNQVWEQTVRSGHRPRLVRLPLTPEIDWFLANSEVLPPRQVLELVDQLVT